MHLISSIALFEINHIHLLLSYSSINQSLSSMHSILLISFYVFQSMHANLCILFHACKSMNSSWIRTY